MRQIAIRGVLAFGLVALGWIAGSASQSQADFILHVTAPGGETKVTCVRGCTLQFIRNAPDRTKAQPEFLYSCSASKCEGEMQGWVAH